MDFLKPPRQFNKAMDRRQSGLYVPSKAAVLTTEAIYDASNAPSLGLSGANVTSWADISGHSNTMTAGTSPTTGGTINGLNALQFTGAAELHPASNFMSGAAGATMMAVCKITSTAVQNGGGPYKSWGNSVSNNHCTFSDANLYPDFGSTSRPNAGTAAGLTSPFLITILSGAGDFRVRINRAALYTSGTNTVGWNVTNTRGGPGFGADPTYNWAGLIGEVRMWKSVLSGTDITTYEGILATKWGTP